MKKITKVTVSVAALRTLINAADNDIGGLDAETSPYIRKVEKAILSVLTAISAAEMKAATLKPDELAEHIKQIRRNEDDVRRAKSLAGHAPGEKK